MRKFNCFLLLILLCVLIPGTVSAAGRYQWFFNAYYNDNYYTNPENYQLLANQLYLPAHPRNTFSLQTKNKLLDLAALYSGRKIKAQQVNILSAESNPESIALDRSIFLNDDFQDSVTLSPLPGVFLNADYQENNEDPVLEKNTNISMEYQMNNRTLIRAEYGLTSKEWWDIKEIKLDNIDPPDPNPPTEPPQPGDEIDPEELKQKEAYFTQQQTLQSRLGISYRTSDNVTISADYIEGEDAGEKDFSTVFGVEYSAELGLLKYKYQMDFGSDNPQTVSGLELGYKDLATFNASYKWQNPELLDSQNSAYTWDFGLNLNINELSSVSVGYQLTNKKEDGFDENISEHEPEENIKAQLEFKF